MRAAAAGVTAKVITLLEVEAVVWVPLGVVPGAGTRVVPTARTGTCWYRVVSWLPLMSSRMSTLSPGWIRPATAWTWSTDTEMATSPWGTVSAATLAMVSGDTNMPLTTTSPTGRLVLADSSRIEDRFVTAEAGRNSAGIFFCWRYPPLAASTPDSVRGIGLAITYAFTSLALW